MVPGSAEQILNALTALGFEWDEPVVRQNTRQTAYREATQFLCREGLAYECTCSRAELEAAQPQRRTPGEELFYPGWCRGGVRAPQRSRALRFQTSDTAVTFTDRLQGTYTGYVSQEVGDFVVRRRDGFYAYQLAVVVDDAAQRITHVTRGIDLLRSTPRQILLQRALGYSTPTYAHLPLATDCNGIKLSKSAGSGAIDWAHPVDSLWRALRFLRQQPPLELRRATPAHLWEWAIEHWQPTHLAGVHQAAIDPLA